VAQGVVKLQPKTAAIISADFGREPKFHNEEHLPIVVWFILANCGEFFKAALASMVPTRLNV
jgi:hypothetical protein